MTELRIDRRGRETVLVAQIIDFYYSGRVRMAVVECPLHCPQGRHDHVVPDNILPNAPLERVPKCKANGRVYALLMPESLSTAGI